MGKERLRNHEGTKTQPIHRVRLSVFRRIAAERGFNPDRLTKRELKEIKNIAARRGLIESGALHP